MRNGVFGLPENYKPAQKPINPWPRGGQPTDPLAAGYDTDLVVVTLKDGTTRLVNFDTGLHPWRNQYRMGPFNWVTDASLLKFFSVTERVKVRVNLDVFNVFNVQGFNPPSADGIVSLGSSFNNFAFRPRQLQGTVRIEW